jgi:3-oxoacyl-[acyl-carrier protein] reductase
MSRISFDGRVAAVTGAGRGIGRAYAVLLAQLGAKVVVNDLGGTSTGLGANAAPANRVVDGIRAAGGTAIANFSDVSTVEGGQSVVDAAIGEFGRIDVLVNNAGIFEAAPIGDEGWTAQWERTLRVNLLASAELCRLAVLHFRARGGGGRIVNVASRAAYRGDSPDHWHYAASKGGMVAMTKSIARAYAGEGIYAFTVCPGFTVTGMVEEYLESRGGIASLGELPLGRPATVAEIAETVRWLAVDAPPSATGAAIDVNGASFVR